MIDPECRGLRRGPDGALYFDGWRVFGHILPVFTLMMFPCYADGVAAEEIGGAPETAAFERLGFVVGWLGYGLCVALGDVERRVR